MANIIYNVGNMVEIPDEQSIACHTNENQLIFVGKMSYEPNIIAVNYFAKKIFPKLRLLYPNIRFTIVGTNPDKKVLRLSEIDGIYVTGFVESISPFFQKSTIVVAPMLTGAGIQNKIIQAMSYGCCVATTSIGAEGLNITNKEIAIFNNENEWVDGIQRLLSSQTIRHEMGIRAREYIKNNLSYEAISNQFWNFIDSVQKYNEPI